MMCSELEYAWGELCPNTKSIAMHQSVCDGNLIKEMRSMCAKCELLVRLSLVCRPQTLTHPHRQHGVLVNHFPLGSGGMDKIDDSWVKLTGENRLS